MTSPRVGDTVTCVLRRAKRIGRVVGLGRDSGGPWVLIEFEDGLRELVHPGRVKKVEAP